MFVLKIKWVAAILIHALKMEKTWASSHCYTKCIPVNKRWSTTFNLPRSGFCDNWQSGSFANDKPQPDGQGATRRGWGLSGSRWQDAGVRVPDALQEDSSWQFPLLGTTSRARPPVPWPLTVGGGPTEPHAKRRQGLRFPPQTSHWPSVSSSSWTPVTRELHRGGTYLLAHRGFTINVCGIGFNES